MENYFLDLASQQQEGEQAPVFDLESQQTQRRALDEASDDDAFIDDADVAEEAGLHARLLHQARDADEVNVAADEAEPPLSLEHDSDEEEERAPVGVQAGREAFATIMAHYTQRISSALPDVPAPKALGVAGVPPDALTQWNQDLRLRGPGLFKLEAPPRLLGAAVLRQYVHWNVTVGRSPAKFLVGVRPPKSFAVLDLFGSLLGFALIAEASFDEYFGGDDARAVLQHVLTRLEGVRQLCVVGVNAQDLTFLADLAAAAAVTGQELQIVASTTGASGDVGELVDAPVRGPSAERRVLESFTACIQSGCAHPPEPRCLVRLRELQFALGARFDAVAPALEKADRHKLKSPAHIERPVVDDLQRARFLLLHRQKQVDLSNVIPFVTASADEADEQNARCVATLAARQSLAVRTTVHYSPDTPASRRADRYVQAVERLATAVYYVGEKVVLLFPDEQHAAGALGTVIEIRDSQPFVCFEASGVSCSVRAVQLALRSADDACEASALVFPLAPAFAVPIAYLQWCQVGEMVLNSRVLAFEVAPALDSLTDLYLQCEPEPAPSFASPLAPLTPAWVPPSPDVVDMEDDLEDSD